MMNFSKMAPRRAIAALAALVMVPVAGPAYAGRDQISIVGSSTVFPFATTVADKFGKKTRFKTPKVVSTGSGGGLKLFCKGVGAATPDIANASRRMKKKEWDDCQANGVKDITEVAIGFDGIVLANAKSAPVFNMSRKQLFLALAARVPGPDGKLIENPYKKWSDVDPSLPDEKIEVLGPPPSSGTRDAFVELALGEGAKQIGWLKKLRSLKKGDPEIQELARQYGIPADFLLNNGKPASGKEVFKKIAYHIREDGAYIDAGENDNKIVDQLAANPGAIGVFGFSFLDQNRSKIKGAKVEGFEPSFDNIAEGHYPVSRKMYFYVKNAHVGVIPGIREYIAEFVSEGASGEDGYLADKGLIPLPEDEHAENAENAKALKKMTGHEKLS